VTVALLTGISPLVWLEDTRAMVTAEDLLVEMARAKRVR
jgi:hypothetical protein